MEIKKVLKIDGYDGCVSLISREFDKNYSQFVNVIFKNGSIFRGITKFFLVQSLEDLEVSSIYVSPESYPRKYKDILQLKKAIELNDDLPISLFDPVLLYKIKIKSKVDSIENKFATIRI